jgi:hypothetical protein
MRINYQSLSTDTLAELVKRVLGVSQKEAYLFVLNHPLLLKLMGTAEKYLIVFDKNTYSGKGEVVAKADLLRDNLFTGLRNSVLGSSQLHGLTTQQDAIDLYAFFETHGLDLYRYSYGDESSHLDKLIEDLEKTENKAKLDRLHLTEAFGLTKSAQVNFEQLFDDQTTANAELRGMQSATSLQSTMVSALRNYLHYVEVMSEIDSQWTALNNELNEKVKAAINSKQSPKKETPTSGETK